MSSNFLIVTELIVVLTAYCTAFCPILCGVIRGFAPSAKVAMQIIDTSPRLQK